MARPFGRPNLKVLLSEDLVGTRRTGNDGPARLSEEIQRETYLSTKPACAQAPTWVSGSNVDQGRSQGYRAASGEGPKALVCVGELFGPSWSYAGKPLANEPNVPVNTLKKRSDFLRVRGGARWSSQAFLLEGKLRSASRGSLSSSGQPSREGARIGFTVTKKLGNAVRRNRIRRRLKAAVEEIEPSFICDDCDYVLVARSAAFDMPYGRLVQDLETAFGRVLSRLGSGKSGKSSHNRRK